MQWCTCERTNVQIHGCEMKGKVQTIKILSPSANIQGSSIFFVGCLPPLLCVFISSPLSFHHIHQLIRWHIPAQIHKLWISFFFPFANKYACFHTANTPGDTHISVCMEYIYFKTMPASEVVWITKWGQNTQSHLFGLFHFQGAHFLPTSAGK